MAVKMEGAVMHYASKQYIGQLTDAETVNGDHETDTSIIAQLLINNT